MKHVSSSRTPAERPTKKARIESSAKINAKRLKNSPSLPNAVKLKARSEIPSATPAQKQEKGKAREITANNISIQEADAPSIQLPSAFTLVAGSYEKLLYGIQGTVLSSTEAASGIEIQLKPSFIFPAHVSCIKAVSASPGGKWLATGSSDEIVKVWDLKRKKEIGGLMHHEGSITYLNFPSKSHLLSASEDGTLCLFRSRDWAVLRALKGHKGRVNCVAIHPSGKLALSVGKDRTLRMWDLMRGKGSASTKLGKEAEAVHWSAEGNLFAIQWQSTIDLYTTDMQIIHTIRHPSRVQDIKFCKRVNGEGDILLVGAEDKKVTIYSISSDTETPPKIVGEMIGHANRVKAIQTLVVSIPAPSPRKSTIIACTVSSDGKMHVYDLFALPAPDANQGATSSPLKVTEITPMAEYDTKGTRLTCLTVAESDVPGPSVAKAGQKRKEASDDESDDDSNGGEEEWDSQVEDEEEEEKEEEEEEEDD